MQYHMIQQPPCSWPARWRCCRPLFEQFPPSGSSRSPGLKQNLRVDTGGRDEEAAVEAITTLSIVVTIPSGTIVLPWWE